MKKIYLGIIAVIGIVSINAAEPQKSYVRIAQEKTIKQFNTSLDRFKRCMHGKCTKGEALKAARDLGIAGMIAITASYGLGTALELGTETISHRIGKPAPTSVYATARYMKTPGEVATQPFSMASQKISRMRTGFNVRDRVQYKNMVGIVKDVNLLRNEVTISLFGTKKPVIVPAKDVTLKERASEGQGFLS